MESFTSSANCLPQLHAVNVNITCNWLALIGKFEDKMPPRLERRRCCCCCCCSWSTSTCCWRVAVAPGGKRVSTGGAVLLRAAGSSELWLAINSAVTTQHHNSQHSCNTILPILVHSSCQDCLRDSIISEISQHGNTKRLTDGWTKIHVVVDQCCLCFLFLSTNKHSYHHGT